MKKIFLMVIGILLVFSGSFANAGNLTYDAAAGLSIPLTSGYDLGFGGEATADLGLGNGLAFTGTVGYYTHGLSNSSTTYIDDFGDTYTLSGSLASLEVLVGLKYAIGSGITRPYIFGQAGISDLMDNVTATYTDDVETDTATGTAASEIDPELAGGIGVNIGLGDESPVSLLIQAKIAAVFGSGSTFSYLPIVVGVNF